MITYRHAEPYDHPATYDIVTKAMQDHRGRHKFPFPRASVIQPIDLALRQYAHEFHRSSYWIAEDVGGAVGFGLAVRNEGRWYLLALHVLPEYQGQGIGQHLLDLTLSTWNKSSDILCVKTESIQPVSTAMYIRAGMLPWIPVFEWTGPMLDSWPDPAKDSSFNSVPGSQELDEIDQKVIGFHRPNEHRFWLEERGLGLEVISLHGTPSGYVYFTKKGELGPAAATSEPLMKPLILQAIRRSRQMGARKVHLKIPGHSPTLQCLATSMGLRIQAPASVLLASRPLWPLGKYLISGSDSLL